MTEPHSHIWQSQEHDYPCTLTGVEWPDADGRIYVKVITADGTEHIVPKDELVPAQGGNGTVLEITLFANDGGPLTKRITLGKDGKPQSDGSVCYMTRGNARRQRLNGIAELPAIIDAMQSNEAIALGCLRDGLPERVTITTRAKLNGSVGPNVIAQRPGRGAW